MEKIYEVDSDTILFAVAEHGVLQRLGRQDLDIVDPTTGLRFLNCFAAPKTLASAKQRFLDDDLSSPQGASANAAAFSGREFARLAEAALRLGVLKAQGDSIAELDFHSAGAKAMLAAINLIAEDLMGDVAAMGSSALGYVQEQTGASLDYLLRQALGELTRVAVALAARRRTYIAQQLAASSAKKFTRLHLGAGGNNLEGWHNIDFAGADLRMNLTWNLPFPSNSIEFVFLSHLFEHVYKRRDAPKLLGEILRVLKPGGTVRLIVPDAHTYMRAYVEQDEAFFAMQRQVWFTWAPKARTHLEAILGYLGAPEFPGGLSQHKYGYDFATLGLMLRDAGFQNVGRSTFMGSAHEALRIDEASYVAGANVKGLYPSLFVEAQK